MKGRRRSTASIGISDRTCGWFRGVDGSRMDWNGTVRILQRGDVRDDARQGIRPASLTNRCTESEHAPVARINTDMNFFAMVDGRLSEDGLDLTTPHGKMQRHSIEPDDPEPRPSGRPVIHPSRNPSLKASGSVGQVQLVGRTFHLRCSWWRYEVSHAVSSAIFGNEKNSTCIGRALSTASSPRPETTSLVSRRSNSSSTAVFGRTGTKQETCSEIQQGPDGPPSIPMRRGEPGCSETRNRSVRLHKPHLAVTNIRTVMADGASCKTKSTYDPGSAENLSVKFTCLVAAAPHPPGTPAGRCDIRHTRSPGPSRLGHWSCGCRGGAVEPVSSGTWQIAHPPCWADRIRSNSSCPIPHTRSCHAAREQGLHQQARPSGRL